MPRPLEGIRVVDLTVERGELCARLLGDLGAEVIKVEPVGGSPARGMPPLHGDRSLFFEFRNAGKLGVALDADDERLHDLLACSDVVVDSAEPGTRPGAEVDDLAARHPHLVCLSITSYGRTGPYAGRDVPDAVLEATGGMAFKAGVPEREPLLPPGNVADDTGAMIGAFAALCALWQKESTGAGQVVDLSVNESVAQIIDWSLSNWTRAADEGQPTSETRAGPGPVYTILPCKDGYVRLVILVERHWRAMRAWLGEPDFLQDPELDTFLGRMMIADAVLNPIYAEHFADMTMEEVSAEGQRRGVVITPIMKPTTSSPTTTSPAGARWCRWTSTARPCSSRRASSRSTASGPGRPGVRLPSASTPSRSSPAWATPARRPRRPSHRHRRSRTSR